MNNLDYLDFKNYSDNLNKFLIKDLSNIINSYLKIKTLSVDFIRKYLDDTSNNIKLINSPIYNDFIKFQNFIKEFSEIYFIYTTYVTSHGIKVFFLGKTNFDNFLYLCYDTANEYISKYFFDIKGLILNIDRIQDISKRDKIFIKNMIGIN